MARAVDVERQFIKTAMAAPYLERDDEHALAVAWKEHGDEKAMHQLAQAHMRLAIAMAARFRHYGLPMNDLIQEGHIGLLEAAARFDPEREVRFSTYATWWIRAAIQDYILRNWSIVRGGTSSAQKSLFFNLRRLRARLSGSAQINGHQHVFNTIANALGVQRADVELMDTRLSGGDMSLNAPMIDSDSGSSMERVDFLVDTKPLQDESVGQAMDEDRRHRWLHDAMKVLNERELRIVRERRLSEEAATLEALGDRLGISKERVRQIENRAIEKLRRALSEQHPAGAVDAMM
jgi:RNA polymerase sigma-32 factor